MTRTAVVVVAGDVQSDLPNGLPVKVCTVEPIGVRVPWNTGPGLPLTTPDGVVSPGCTCAVSFLLYVLNSRDLQYYVVTCRHLNIKCLQEDKNSLTETILGVLTGAVVGMEVAMGVGVGKSAG